MGATRFFFVGPLFLVDTPFDDGFVKELRSRVGNDSKLARKIITVCLPKKRLANDMKGKLHIHCCIVDV